MFDHLKFQLQHRGRCTAIRPAMLRSLWRLGCCGLAVACALLLTDAASALEVIGLTGDAGNSSAPGFGTDINNTVNDPFAYDPLVPTSPLPALNHPNNFHGQEAEGTSVILSYDFTDGAITLTEGQAFAVDLYGRTECCRDRDNDIDIELYNGGVTGTLVASVTGLSISDVDPLHVRGFVGDVGQTFDSLRVLGNDSAVDGENLFTLQEIRAAVIDDTFARLTVNRETGEISIRNDQASALNILAYSLESNDGGLSQAGWTTIAGNSDANGNGSVDSDDTWTVLTGAGVSTDLSEAEFSGGNGGVIASGQTVSFGNAWKQSPTEDVTATLLLDDGDELTLPVFYEGNGDESFQFGDLNFSGGAPDAADWITYLSKDVADLSDASPIDAYRGGDLNGDGFKNIRDMDRFIEAFEAANGVGSFAAMVASVPEPTTGVMILTGILALVFGGNRRRLAFASTRAVAVLAMLTAAVVCLSTQQSAQAASINWGNVFEIFTDDDIDTSGTIISAVNGGPAAAADIEVTINSKLLTFVSPDPSLMASGNLGAGGIPEVASTGNAELDEVFDSHTWTSGDLTGAPVSFSIPGLTAGQAYQVQIVSAVDGRGCCLDRTQTYADGPTISANISDPLARASDVTTSGMLRANSVIGTFTADGTSQDIWVEGAVDPGISAYILSAVGEVATLTLEVDPVDGQMRIANNSSLGFDINGYEITSAGGALNPAGWSSFADQGLDSIGGGDGESWAEDATSSSTVLSEGFLLGNSSFAAAAAQGLGTGFDTSVFGAGNDGDLEFRFRAADGSIKDGTVAYVDIDDPQPGLPGDFDGSGAVGNSDLTLLLDNWGATVPPIPSGWTHDLPTEPGVGNDDLTRLLDNWGASAQLAISAVPEPTTGLLAAFGLISSLGLARRRRGGHKTSENRSAGLSRFCAILICSVAWAVMSSAAWADVTNDRFYQLGDDSLEGNTSAGGIVGAASGNVADGSSLDSGEPGDPSGSFLDLSESGGPTYVDVGSLGRPGASNGDLGAQFDGDNDVLTAVPLNRPEEMESLLGGASYPFNYTGILEHGNQMWVRPTQAGIDGGTYQSILFDSIGSGGPAINEAGQWTQSNAGHVNGNGAVPASVAVPAGDTWYHVMHHHFPQGGNNFNSVVYVDGVAVSANLDAIGLGGTTGGSRVGQLVVGAAEISGDGAIAEYGLHFQGAIDDIKMYVAGNNTAVGGQNYGTFDLFADNDWIADAIAGLPGGTLQNGDLDKDGDVDQDDVDSFVANWKRENTFQGAHGTTIAGDWNTWSWGDMNHDGTVNLSDAFLMHQALSATPIGGLDFSLLGAAVPEPSSAALLLLAAAGAGAVRRRR